MSKKFIPNSLLKQQLKIEKGKRKSKRIIGYQKDCGDNDQPIYSDEK